MISNILAQQMAAQPVIDARPPPPPPMPEHRRPGVPDYAASAFFSGMIDTWVGEEIGQDLAGCFRSDPKLNDRLEKRFGRRRHGRRPRSQSGDRRRPRSHSGDRRPRRDEDEQSDYTYENQSAQYDADEDYMMLFEEGDKPDPPTPPSKEIKDIAFFVFPELKGFHRNAQMCAGVDRVVKTLDKVHDSMD